MSKIFFNAFIQLLMHFQYAKSYLWKQCYNASCCQLREAMVIDETSIDQDCFTKFGHNYRGQVNVTNTGISCINWMSTSMVNTPDREKERYGIGEHNHCRNPDPFGTRKPWCYVSFRNYGYCKVDPCKTDLEYDSSENNRKSVKLMDCGEEGSLESNQSDIIFSVDKNYYFLTKRHNRTAFTDYVLYNFTDENMTSFGKPIVQILQDAVNLCVGNDVITFVTLDDRNMTYLYMQRPNVMLQVDLKRKGWKIVDHDIYRSCLYPTLQSAKIDQYKEISIKSVFTFINPKQLLLMTRKHKFECRWMKGYLRLVRQEKRKHKECLHSRLMFTTKKNITYAITTDFKHREDNENYFKSNTRKNNSKSNEIHTKILKTFKTSTSSDILEISAEEVLSINPLLSEILMEYEVLNNDTDKLVKLCDAGNTYSDLSGDFQCSSAAGNKSRLFRIYNEKQLENIFRWLKFKNINVVLNFHSVYMCRPDFCQNLTNICCKNLKDQFEETRNSEAFAERLKLANNKLGWLRCILQFRNSSTCPILICFSKITVLHQRIFFLCEIKLVPDPIIKEISLEDILGTSDEYSVRYINAKDASLKIGLIADSIRSSTHSKKLDLGLLFSSIEALQPLNFDDLQSPESRAFISNFLMIVDNLADNERTNDWIEKKKNEDKVLNNPKNQDNYVSSRDPHSLLFITEAILERISSKKNLLRNFSDVLKVETKNVISTARQKYFNNSISNSDSHLNSNYEVKVTSSSANPRMPIVVVTSLFPHILETISKIEKGFSEDKKCLFGSNICNSNQNVFPVPNSTVLSTNVMQNQTRIPSSVRFQLPFTRSNFRKLHLDKQKYYLSCSYLTRNNTWDTRGCRVTYSSTNNNESVHCTCNHTTNFAIILQVISPQITDEDLSVLTLISNIGESLSTFCLIVTLTVLGMLRQSLMSDRIVAHFNLIIALILFHSIQLFSFNAESWKDVSATPCIAVTFLSHFSLLAAFMWMLCEGITLHFNVVDVFSTHTAFKMLRYLIGWGVPFVIAVSSLLYGLLTNPYPTCYVQGVGKYSCRSANDNSKEAAMQQQIDPDPNNQLIEKCWLSVNNYLILALFVPAVSVLIINTAVMIRVSLLISQSSKAVDRIHRPSMKKMKKNSTHFRKSLKGVIILMPILGVPWIFGAIPQSLTHVAFLYVFTLINSTQGVFLFLFYCILNNEVRNAIARCLRKRKPWFHQQSSFSQQSHSRNQTIELRQKYETDTEKSNTFATYRRKPANNDRTTSENVSEQALMRRGDSNGDSGCFFPERDFQSASSSPDEQIETAFLHPVNNKKDFGPETCI